MSERDALNEATSTGVWTVDQLRIAEAVGLSIDFLFFWGHTSSSGSAVGPHVLSQWFEQPFELDGISYRSAEHYMMAEKARSFGDSETERAIIAAESPREAKALGRTVKGFDADRWSARSLDVVTKGSVAKFQSSDEFQRYLLGTANRVLVEASPVDAIWGIGLASDDPAAKIPSQWPGRNLLGLALMRARAELRR